MKKAEYQIRLVNRIDSVKGYVFSTGKYTFGVSNYVNGRKYPNYWSVTELQTGLNAGFGSFNTRAEAVAAIVKFSRSDAFAVAVSGAVEKYGKINEAITADEVILAAI